MKSTYSFSARALALGGSLLVLGSAGCNEPNAARPSAPPGRFAPGASALLQPTITLFKGDTTSVISPLALWALREILPLTWSSGNTAKLRVSSAGVVTAIDTGTTHAIVSVLTWTDSIPVTITNVAVANVVVAPPAGGVTVGTTAQLGVTLKDANGNVLTGRPVTYSSSNTGVATVGSTGVVYGQQVGSVTFTARSGPASGGVTVTVAAGSGGGSAVQLPALPQTFSISYPSVTGKSWVLRPGDNLQNALNAAKRGDEIVLPAGAKFTGNFTLPPKPGTASNGWIIIRSDKLAQLPKSGTRVTPAQANLMPSIISDNQTPALATAPSASGWWIAGIDIASSGAWLTQAYSLVQFGGTGSQQSSLSQVPTDLVLERSYVHGASNSRLSRCIALNSARTAIVDNYVTECHGKGFDAQAIAGWNGPGPFKIVNNTLIGSGENVMFGGSDPTISNLVPADVEIRRNYIYTPANWKNVWMKKNLFESKNVQRVLIEGNVFDGSWMDGQTGFAFLLKSANQSGQCTWCKSRDLTIRLNIVRNVGAGFNLAGREGTNKYKVGELLNHILIEQNVVENVNYGQFLGDARLLQFIQNPSQITVRNNTMSTNGQLATFMTIGSTPAATDVDIRNNVFGYGTYGLFSSSWGSTEQSLQGMRGIINFRNMTLIGAWRSGYPNGSFVSSLSAAIATGNGANTAQVNAATQGVIVP